MNKRGLLLLLLGAWGVSRLMGPNGSTTREKVRGMAEQVRGRVERVVGRATGSDETRVRGGFDEMRGMGREKVADVEAAMDEITGR